MASKPPGPPRCIVFAGHRVDAPGRVPARFPEHLAQAAASRIGQELATLDAGPADLALTQGAAGGDLLFAECALMRGMRLRFMQPFDEPRFVSESVASRGERWVARYDSVKARVRPKTPILSALTVLGQLKDGEDAWERCNRWLITQALAGGAERMVLIALWDGGGADGPGGTAQMVEMAAQSGGKVVWIDTRTLSGLGGGGAD